MRKPDNDPEKIKEILIIMSISLIIPMLFIFSEYYF